MLTNRRLWPLLLTFTLACGAGTTTNLGSVGDADPTLDAAVPSGPTKPVDSPDAAPGHASVHDAAPADASPPDARADALPPDSGPSTNTILFGVGPVGGFGVVQNERFACEKCDISYAVGATVTVTYVPTPGHGLGAWGGTGPCFQQTTDSCTFVVPPPTATQTQVLAVAKNIP